MWGTVGSSNMADCLGFVKVFVFFSSFSPSPLRPHYSRPSLTVPCTFTASLFLTFPPHFPSPQHHWPRACGLHCVHLEVGRNEQTRKQTLMTPKLLSSISCHLYNKKTLIPAWLFYPLLPPKTNPMISICRVFDQHPFGDSFCLQWSTHSPLTMRCKVPSPSRHS